ncbi:Transcription factor E [Candidatus Bilamarchaeum dharawalense]|uniref:Transcription factor E n=1 Tax=Candidatus Bilamarchaeum dharawalense TaxID=2885759 RepID=A0A5E4LL15_9ARCH|nr:Transcription factor E [Candidatus Bilamarchaeum dharawalense]
MAIKKKKSNTHKTVKKAKKVKVVVKKAVKATFVKKVVSVKKPKISKAAMEREAKKAADEVLKLRQQEEQKKMQNVVKILSDAGVRQNLIEIGGENALAMVRSFYGNHSDEDLAKKLKIKISDVRATLNKLHNEGLVNYIREKDSETGWYSYSWSLNHDRIEKWATIQSSRIGLNESSDYYFCPSCGASSIINFESASGVDFRCERCNRLLEFIDEKKLNELYEKMKV